MIQQEETCKGTPTPWELPEDVLFLVVSYVAGPTRRASVLCHCLAVLCKTAKTVLLDDETRAGPIWDIVLREDYTGTSILAGAHRRSSKRLRKNVMQQVQTAHSKCCRQTPEGTLHNSLVWTGTHLTR